MDLNEMAAKVKADGPTRVVVSSSGEAVPPARARQEFGATPAIIFIRKDGWSLGAPKALAAVAEGMWADEWLGVILAPSGTVKFYSEYKAVQDYRTK